MKSFAIALGCLAWVLSCFDAVSYYRAGSQQGSLQTHLRSEGARAESVEASAGRDDVHIRARLERDRIALAADQRALDHDAKVGAGDAQDKQTLAADQAAMQADRMMQYTLENFAKTDPNPQVVAAENRVDLDRRLLAETVATRSRDLSLAHVLLALWVLVAGTTFLAFRGRGRNEGSANGGDAESDVDERANDTGEEDSGAAAWSAADRR